MRRPFMYPGRIGPLTWRHSVSDPGVLQYHLLHLLVGPEQQAVPLLAEVVRALQVPDDGQLRLQGLHLRHRRCDDVLVVNRDSGVLEANQVAHLSGPESCHQSTYVCKSTIIINHHILFGLWALFNQVT